MTPLNGVTDAGFDPASKPCAIVSPKTHDQTRTHLVLVIPRGGDDAALGAHVVARDRRLPVDGGDIFTSGKSENALNSFNTRKVRQEEEKRRL